MNKLVLLAFPLLMLIVGCESDAGSDGAETADSLALNTDAPAGTAVGTINSITGEPLAQAGAVDYALVPTVAPEFSWKGEIGGDGSLADYRGSVVMINFWGTWCPPCRRELPDIVSLREEYSSRGFEVLGVAINEKPKGGKSIVENLAGFANANNMNYPLLIASNDVIIAYGSPPSVPTTFIIDRSGKIASVHVGLRSEADFRSAIEPLL